MHSSLLTIAYASLILVAAASPVTISTSTYVSGTSFDGDTPPQSHMLGGLAAGIAVAGLLTGGGVMGAGRYCYQKREKARKQRYRQYQEKRASDEVGMRPEGIAGTVEDGFWLEDGKWAMVTPKTPPPSYAGSLRGEDA